MKAKTLYKIFFAVLCAIIGLFGCSVTTPDPAPAPHIPAPSQIVVSGTINTDNGRSATVDLNKLDLTWYVIATQNEKYQPSATDPTADVNNGKFTLTLPEAGNWVIYAGGFAGQPNDTYTNYVIGGMTDIITVPKSGVSNLTITASPRINGREYGSVSLSFKDESEQLAKVCIKGTYPLNDKEVTFTNGSATLTYGSVLANEYPVTLLFNDDLGNTLYRCKEVINVIQDCTTDTWSGNSTYFATENGKKILTVTLEMVEAYGTECVPNTDVVVYDVTEDDDGYITTSFYLSSDGKKEEDQAAVTSFYAPSSLTVPISSCFDGKGNLYVLKKEYNEDEDEWNTSIYSNKNNFGNNNYVSCDGLDFQAIKIDRKTDILYGCADDDDGQTLYLYAYPNLVSSNTLDGMITYRINGISFNESVLCFYNDKLFVPSIKTEYDYINGAEICNLVLAEINLTTDLIRDVNSQSETYTKNFQDENFPTLNLGIELSSGMRITDTLYQDGCLYMLLNECYNSGLNIHSRGAVIKYDIITKQLDYCGWTNTNLSNNDKYVYLASNGLSSYILRTGTDEVSDRVLGKADEGGVIQLYSPENGNEAFYGPQRFVAIRPKKLVIADNGVAFYTDELNAYYAKNVNRIVTVDLERFAIDETADPNVSFERDYQELFVQDDSSYSSDLYKKFDDEYSRITEGNVYYGDGVDPFYFSFEQTFSEFYANAKPIIPIK